MSTKVDTHSYRYAAKSVYIAYVFSTGKKLKKNYSAPKELS